MSDEGRPAADGGEAATANRTFEEGTLAELADGVVTLDADWTVTDANDAAREILGAGASGLVGADVREAFPEGAWLEGRFAAVLDAGEATTVEVDGGERDTLLEVRVHPTHDGVTAILREVTGASRTREELEERERALRRLHDIALDAGRSPAETIEGMLAVGRDRLGVELGFLTSIGDQGSTVVELVGDHPELQEGSTTPLSETYCRKTVGREEPLAVADTRQEESSDDPASGRDGLGCYLGATITVDDRQYGTVCFADAEPRERPFSESERTFVELLTGWISRVLERRRYEDRLRADQCRLETATENVPVVVFACDPGGTFTLSRGRGLESVSFEPGEVVGESIFDVYQEYPDICRHARRALDGEATHHTVELADGVTLEVWYQPVVEDGEVTQVVGVARDITELAEHRERLSGLLETTRSLMQARSREEVADLVATAALDVLGFEANAVHLYDADAEVLEVVAETTAADVPVEDRPAYGVEEGMPGRVFATGESRIIDDLQAIDVETNTDVLQSAMYYPMGVHGTLTIASTEPAAFDGADEQVLALLATAAAAACTRARRERQVRKAREHVETVLERINGLVENTVEILVGATTREELESGVVEQLAAADPYTFAGIGRPDVAGETLSPTEWTGTASVPLADATFSLDGSNPVADAVETGRPQVVEPGDVSAGMLGCTGEDAQTAMVVPLVYRDTMYGVFVVFADQVGAFDERERVVLTALGRAVANAINAIERGRILEADEVIELELAIDDPDLLFSRLAAGCECTIEVADFDYRSDGRLRLYLSADGEGETLAGAARTVDAVEDVQLIVDTDENCLLELTVEASLIERLGEFGAVVRDVVAEAGVTRVTVELPYEAEAREVFDLVEDRHPDTELVGYHEHERPVRTRQEFRAALADRFTDRQETALRTAYLGGFFDWPREIDGNDLAEAMDVSRPTYHQHLRTAQRKVFEELFE
jgi:PAS domain S-box-containing protein